MSASPPRGVAELTAGIEELPEEYGLSLISQLPQADLSMLRAALERIITREATSPRERATRTRLTTFLAEVSRRMPPDVTQSSDTGPTTATPGELRRLLDKAFDNPYTGIPLTFVMMFPVGLICLALLWIALRWIACWVFCEPY